METNSQSCTFLARFFLVVGNLSVQITVWISSNYCTICPYTCGQSRKKKKAFSFDCGMKVCTQAASTAHSLCCGIFTSLYLRGVCVCTQKELFLRGLEGNLVAPFNCFLPEASTNLLGSAPRGVAIVLFCFFFFLHKVMFALLLKSKVVSHLAFILFKVWCSPWQLTKISS